MSTTGTTPDASPDLVMEQPEPPRPAADPTEPVVQPDPEPAGDDAARHDRPLVIIPAWNEEAALPAVLASLREIVPAADVLVISDGSTDATAHVARQAGAQVVVLPYNLGIGGALRTGFRYAERFNYQRAVQFDADGQHDATQIARLLAAIDDGADLAIGSRFAPPADGDAADYRVGKVRGRAMGLLRFTVKRVTKQNFTDTSSGFRAFSRPMLQYFADTYPSEYMESVEALLMAHRAGFTVVEVPVVMRERQDGEASNRRLKLLYHYCRLLLVIVASAPRRKRSSS
jgi:glycosyltransferase involved in cell wall biosynthesis